MLKRLASIFFACALSLGFLTACPSTGILATPQGVNGKAAAADTLAAEIGATVGSLAQAGKISKADAQDALDQVKLARVAIENARGIGKTDLLTAAGKLAAIDAGLQALKGYLITLAAKQGAKP
jgi:hypothetical protein